MPSKPKSSGKKSTFYPVSREEMESFLTCQEFRLLNDPNNRESWPADLSPKIRELVYSRRVFPKDKNLSIRVYSGIWLSGEARDSGEDAIRVCLVWRDPQPYLDWLALPDEVRAVTPPAVPVVRGIGSTAIVKRIETWRKNLRERIVNFETMLGPICKCGRPKVERQNKNTKEWFWACCGYHDYGCKG